VEREKMQNQRERRKKDKVIFRAFRVDFASFAFKKMHLFSKCITLIGCPDLSLHRNSPRKRHARSLRSSS
jgi:hypothetical protein